MTIILEATRGDHEIYELTLLDAAGDPVDLTGIDEMWFTAKLSHRNADGDAVVAKTLTGTGIAIVDALAGRADVTLDPADTAALGPWRTELVFDVQVRDATGTIATVESGTLVVKPDVTQATA